MAAFATLLEGQSYVAGAITLAKTLRKIGTDHSLIVLVDKTSLSQESLDLVEKAFDKSIDISDSKISASIDEVASRLGRAELTVTYSKILLWSLTEFRQIIYLDADTLPLKSLDHLFDEYSSLPNTTVAAAPDIGWPDLFNTGMMILKPNLDTFTKIKQFASEEGSSFDGADQGLLNEFFNLAENGFSWHRLPFLYNVTPSPHYQYAPALTRFFDQINVVHFIGEHKPWNLPLGLPRDSFAIKWWEAFEEFFPSEKDRIALLLKGTFQLETVEFNRLDPPWSTPQESVLDRSLEKLTVDDEAPTKVFPWEDHEYVQPTRVFQPIKYEEENAKSRGKRVSLEKTETKSSSGSSGEPLKNHYDQFDGENDFDPDKALEDVAKIPMKFLRKASK